MHAIAAIRSGVKRRPIAAGGLCYAVCIGQVAPVGAQVVNTATVTGFSNGVLLTDSATEEVDVADAIPLIAATKTAILNDNDGTPGLSAGDTVSFGISVSNIGNVTVSNVTLTDTMTQGATTLAYDTAPILISGDAVNPTFLDVGETWQYEATLTLTQTIINNGAPILNRADFSGNFNTVGVTASADATTPLAIVPDFTLTKTPNVASADGVGDIVSWDITVTNTGTTTLNNISVSDPIADSLVCPSSGATTVVTLDPSDFETCVALSLLTAGDIVGNQVTNTASAIVTTPSEGDITRDATAILPVINDALPSISGTVFTDLNSNGLFDGADTREQGYIVQLALGGVVVAQTVTDALGDYLFTDFAAGTYSLIFIDPATGIGVGSIEDIIVADTDVIVDQDLPIDPSGVVYSSFDGTPIAGATLTITTSTGTPLPAACLLPNQQTQTTGADGAYRFDIVPGGDALCPTAETEYRLQISAPATFEPVPSTVIPPQTGALDATTCALDVTPGGSCALSLSDIPDELSPSPYFLAFDLEAGDPDVVRNHIPIDPVPPVPADGLVLAKTSSTRTVRIGDRFEYAITLTNNLTDPAGPVSIVDTLPPGFPVVPGSARLDGAPFTFNADGSKLTFDNIIVPAQTAVEVTFDVRVSTSVTPGDYVNIAIGRDATYGNAVTNQARAVVTLDAEPVFDCGEIIGKVFDDRNADGWQDQGEEGLAGIRLATANGTLITTDEFGRYSVPCAAIPDTNIGSNFIVKLDDRTLPTGYAITTENPRVVRLTPGKLSKLNFGATRASLVEFTVTDDAFLGSSTTITSALEQGIGQLADSAIGGPTMVRVTYLAGTRENQKLPKARLTEIEDAVRKRFALVGIREELEFEPIVVRP